MTGSQALYRLIRRLADKNIKVWTENKALKFKAPKGALDSELKNDMIALKPELIDFLEDQELSQHAISRRPDLSTLPISHAQRRLWFIDQSSDDCEKPAYNIPIAVGISGALDIRALRASVQAIVNKHEVLQTYFENQQGLPIQKKALNPSVDIRVKDLSHLSEEEREAQSQSEIDKNIATIFNLSVWPIFKLDLIQTEHQEYIFLATMHHIVADGWSMDVLLKEISDNYQIYIKPEDDRVETAKDDSQGLQYADYAFWQNNYLEDKRFESQLAFWEKYLSGSEVLELPLDYKRNIENKNIGKKAQFLLDTHLTSELENLAHKQGVTLFMVLSAGFNILLSRFSRQSDISLGIPVANRSRPEWEPLIGFFVNTLVLRSDLSNNPKFTNFLKQIQENTLAIYSNQELPFDKIVESLVDERSTSHSPLFQVMFSLQNKKSENNFTLENLQLKVLENGLKYSRLDMTWSLVETQAGITINIEYRKDIFSEKTIGLYFKYYANLVQEIIEDPKKPIDDYSLLTYEENQSFLKTLQADALAYPKEKFIGEIFDEIAEKYPQNVALSLCASSKQDLTLRKSDGSAESKDCTISYQALSKNVNALANYLSSVGVEAQDRVILMLPRSIEMTQYIIALLKLGACYVPVDPDYPVERKLYIQKDSAAKLIITSRYLANSLNDLNQSDVTWLYLEDIAESIILFEKNLQLENNSGKAGQHRFHLKQFNCSQLAACIFYTSGSTGEPKGVIVPHRAIVRLVSKTNFADYSSDQVVAHISNVCFDASSMEIWGALLNGGRLHILAQESLLSIVKFSREIETQNISIMFLSMGLFRLYANEQPNMFGGLNSLLIGGEAVDLGAAHKVLNSACPPAKLINGYGPTENTTFTATHHIKCINENTLSAPLGKAINHSSVYIADKQGRILPPGIPGELICAGDGLALGYLNKESLSKEKFISGFLKGIPEQKVYKSGDLARISEEGVIVLDGRLDNQIKLRGFRIEPEEIEFHIEKIKEVKDCSVALKTNAQGDRFLVAYIVINDSYIKTSYTNANKKSTNDPLEEASSNLPQPESTALELPKPTLLSHIKSQAQNVLPAYMMPSFFEMIEALPLNANGKLDKKSLPELDWSMISEQNHIAPRDDIERELAGIWGNLLGLNNPSIKANFFELGGHSLIATQLASRIEERFLIEFKVKRIFESATIELIADYIKTQAKINENKALITKVDCQGSSPLSQAQKRLWFIHQVDPLSSAYGMPMAIKLSGSLNVERLERSITLLIARHESLRTVFIEEEGEPKQKVKEAPLSFTLQQSLAINTEQVDEAISNNQKHCFNLDKGPLFHAELLKQDEGQFLLLMNMHHIISDGWSMQILQQDLMSIYANDSDAALQPLPIQYIDYSHWQREHLDETRTNALLQYWLQELNEVERFLHLPADLPRPSKQSFNGKVHRHHLNASLQNDVLNYCKENKITTFVFGLCAYGILLSKYSQQNDFCIGIPVSGRDQAEIENIIGFFVNGIVIRCDLRERLSIKECLQKFKNKTLDAFSHQDLSADLLINALDIKPNSSYQPLAQVAFSHQSIPPLNDQLLQLSGLENLNFEVMPSENNSAKYDLLFSFGDSGDHLDIACEYASDLFEESTIALLLERYEYTLQAMLSNDGLLVDELTWLNERDILSALNNPKILKNKKNIGLITKAFPLSLNQQAIYLDCIINPKTQQNSVGNFVELKFEVDLNIWEKALIECQKYEIFRTHFIETDLIGSAGIYQCISNKAPSVFKFEDLAEEKLSFEDLAERFESEIYCSYDILNDPLYGFSLIKLADKHYACMVKAHHIIFDGVSGKIILEDILEIYQALYSTKIVNKRLDNYQEYIKEKSLNIDNPESLAFWKQQSKSLEPLNFRRPSYKNIKRPREHIQQELTLSETQFSAIKKYCKKKKVTPSIFFKTLYTVLIHQYCQPEADFHILEYSHGRDKNYQKTYGVFYQQSPYIIPMELFQRNGFNSDVFHDLLTHARRFQKASRQWRDISIQAQSILLPNADIGFMYNFTQFETHLSVLGEPARTLFMSPRLDQQVQLFVREQNSHYQCLLLFTSSNFNDLRLLERLSSLVNTLVVEDFPYTSIPSSPLLLNDEAQLLNGLVTSHSFMNKSPYPKEPSHEFLLDNFSKLANSDLAQQVAIISESTLSYADLEQRSHALAGILIQQYQLSQGELVAIHLPLNQDYVIALFAILKCGAGYVPIELSHPKERIRHMLKTANVSLIISDSTQPDNTNNNTASGIFTESTKENDSAQLCFIDQIDLSTASNFSSETASDWNSYNDHTESLNALVQERIQEHKPENVLYSIFTSGSTGMPKGAQVSHQGEQNLLAWYEPAVNISPGDKCLIVSAPGFDLTQKNLFAFLRCGASLVLHDLPLFDPVNLRELIFKHQVTHINCAPSVLYSLLEFKNKPNIDLQNKLNDCWEKLKSLRYVVLGGETINLSELQPWYQSEFCQARIINSYGPTECTDVVCAYELKDQDFELKDQDFELVNHQPPSSKTSKAAAAEIETKTNTLLKPVPLGQAIPGCDIYILDTFGNLQVPGIVGEIAIGGRCLGLGYIANPALNKETFIEINTEVINGNAKEKVYLSGDLGVINSQGLLEYIGRKDFQIKLRGQRIELGEIETQLRALETIKDALLVVENEQLLAYVIQENNYRKNLISVAKNNTGEASKALSSAEMLSSLEKILPKYMVPKYIVSLDAWPLNANGKVDRKSLPKLEQLNKHRSIVEAKNDYEQTLVNIWSEVLGVNEISTDDNFFSLGGHSLLATKAVSRIKEHYKIEFPLKVLFDLNTLSDLASYIKTLRWAIDVKQESLSSTATQQSEAVSESDQKQVSPKPKRDEGFL